MHPKHACGLALRERCCVALRYWSLSCPVAPRWGLVRGSPARRVLGLEAQHPGRPVAVWGQGGRVGYGGRFVRPGCGRRPCCPAVLSAVSCTKSASRSPTRISSNWVRASEEAGVGANEPRRVTS